MPTSDGWNDEEHAKFCSLLKATWELEQSLRLCERSSEKQIWSQISDKLSKAGFKRGAHVCQGHWFYVVRHQPEFQNTFPFRDKPLPNNLRNSDTTVIVDTGTPRRKRVDHALETPDPRPQTSRATLKLNQNQNSLMLDFEAEKKKGFPPLESSQRLNSEPSAETLSMDPTGKRLPTQKWTDEEFAKLEELVNKGIKANDLRSEGQRLDGIQFFEVVSKQLRELGIERGASACKQKWLRAYPKGNEVKREIIGLENEIVISNKPDTSKTLEASDLALRWSEDESRSLTRTIAESYLDRKDEYGNVVMSSINWTMVENKHRANGYTRTLFGLQARWGKQQRKVRPLPNRVNSDSDDDRPLSELRANRFKVVNDTVISSLSFDKKSSLGKAAEKQGNLNDKKRSRPSMLITESDDEPEERQAKRVSKPKQGTLSKSATSAMRSQIQDLEAQISNLERNTAAAPNAIGEYETELQDIDIKMEKLREQKEKIQAAKMKKWEVMRSGGEKIKSLRDDMLKLEDAVSVMEKMGL